MPVLSHLSMGFMAGITSDYSFTATADGEAITAEMVPELARQSFPLCMRNMQETLKTAKHLKHEGRQQYNLFLKVSLASDDIQRPTLIISLCFFTGYRIIG